MSGQKFHWQLQQVRLQLHQQVFRQMKQWQLKQLLLQQQLTTKETQNHTAPMGSK